MTELKEWNPMEWLERIKGFLNLFRKPTFSNIELEFTRTQKTFKFKFHSEQSYQ